MKGINFRKLFVIGAIILIIVLFSLIFSFLINVLIDYINELLYDSEWELLY